MNNNYFNPYMFTNQMNIRQIPKLRAGINLPKIAGQSKITFQSILNGTSKTLGVINQAIPVFYQIKPIWKNAKTMFKVAKEINKNDKNTPVIKEEKKIQKKEENKSPTYFL